MICAPPPANSDGSGKPRADVAESVDARDLKSCDLWSCGFESRRPHHPRYTTGREACLRQDFPIHNLILRRERSEPRRRAPVIVATSGCLLRGQSIFDRLTPQDEVAGGRDSHPGFTPLSWPVRTRQRQLFAIPSFVLCLLIASYAVNSELNLFTSSNGRLALGRRRICDCGYRFIPRRHRPRR